MKIAIFWGFGKRKGGQSEAENLAIGFSPLKQQLIN